jgi:uncharacterized repeat protein (TIGR03803 family)
MIRALSIFAAALLLAGSSWAQATDQVIHSFSGAYSAPISKLIDANGRLFGATQSGGNGSGTVFEMVFKSGGWTYRDIYTFKGSADGYGPRDIFMDAAGNIFGTTYIGGGNGVGSVYKLTPGTGGSWTKTTIYSFAGGLDGEWALSDLTQDAAGNLYGTTEYGGAYARGTVYQLKPKADGSWSESVLYSFGAASQDGLNPVAEVTFDSKGNLYGTTQLGGASGYGTVFELAPNSGGWTESVLYSFPTKRQGSPSAPAIVDSAGNIFGTADGGQFPAGIFFELKPNGDGTWTEHTFHQFGAQPGDGATPGGLTSDGHGNFYAPTAVGGANGWGAIIKLTRGVGNTWTESVVYSFAGGSDGAGPYTPVTVGKGGIVYGTTLGGGSPGYGTVFELRP